MVTLLCGRPAFSFMLMRQRIGEGFIFALSYSTTGLYNDIDKAMLGHFGMNVANGIYTMAYRVVDVFTMPISSVQGAAFPRFFRKATGGVQQTAGFAVQIIKRTAPVALMCAAGMMLVAPWIPHLVGKGFSESVPALQLLCLLPLFRSFHLAAGDALTAAGHQKLRLASQATAAGFNFSANLYLIPLYSWHGAAWSSLFTDGLLAIFNWSVLSWIARGKKVACEVAGAESA